MGAAAVGRHLTACLVTVSGRAVGQRFPTAAATGRWEAADIFPGCREQPVPASASKEGSAASPVLPGGKDREVAVNHL